MSHALPDPRNKLQSPLTRLPRWMLIVLGVAVLIPIIVLGITILVVGLTTGFIVLAAVLLAYGILTLAWKLAHRKKPTRSPSRPGEIVVRARVIDP